MNFYSEFKLRIAFTVGCETCYAPPGLSATHPDLLGNNPGRPLGRCPAPPCKLPTRRGFK